jgi:hypothetical protein
MAWRVGAIYPRLDKDGRAFSAKYLIFGRLDHVRLVKIVEGGESAGYLVDAVDDAISRRLYRFVVSALP